MMAHRNKVVVSVFNQETGAPLRGYDHQKLSRKTCRCRGNCFCIETEYGCRETVYLPFNTEYGFKFKFQDGVRRRVRITIDGTVVVSDLILRDGVSLERFQDTNKRFKFVSLDNPSVQDPTSEDNGSVKIELWKEKSKPTPRYSPMVYTRTKGVGSDSWGGGTLRSMSMSMSPVTDGLIGATSASYGTSSSRGMDFQNLSMDCSYSDRGATVEGKTSSQTFGTTTWEGDEGQAEVFVFDLRANRVQADTPIFPPEVEILFDLAKVGSSAKTIFIRPETLTSLARLDSDVFIRNTDRATLELNLTGWLKGVPVIMTRYLGQDWKIV